MNDGVVFVGLHTYITIFKILIWTFLLDTFLTRRFSRLKTYLLSIAVFLPFNWLLLAYYHSNISATANFIAGMAQYAFLFVIAFIFYTNKKWTIVAATGVTIFIYALLQVALIPLSKLLPVDDIYKILTTNDVPGTFKQTPIPVLVVFFLMYFFTFIVCFCISLLYKRYLRKDDIPQNAKFVLLPFSQAIALLLYYMCFFHNQGQSADGLGIIEASMLVVIIIFIFTDISLWRVIVNMRDKSRLEKQYELLEQFQISSFQQYTAINAQYRKERVFRHDINNKLITAKSLIDSNNLEEAKKLLSEISSSFSAHTLVQFCENPIVNTILNNKNTYAQSLDIKLNVTAKVNELKIGLSDLCSVVSNILDNAIEATEKLQNTPKEINADISLKGDYFIVKCQNPIETDVSLETTKPDTEVHGYGISILRSICEQYEGNLTFEQSDSQFTVTAILRDIA